MSETRFIRKNGRIIPIRAKKTTAQDDLRAGAHSALGAVALSKVGIPLIYKAAVKSEGPAVDISKFRSEYADFIKKAGNPDFRTDAYGPHTMAVLTRHRKRIKKNIFTGFSRPAVIVGTKFRSESVLLHELGHIRASRRKYTINHFYRASGIKAQRAFDRTGKLKMNKLGDLFKMVATRKTQLIWNLGLEAEASGEAIRAASKAKGWKHGAKIGARLALPYATYMGGASVVGLGAYGAYRVGKGLVKMASDEKGR